MNSGWLPFSVSGHGCKFMCRIQTVNVDIYSTACSMLWPSLVNTEVGADMGRVVGNITAWKHGAAVSLTYSEAGGTGAQNMTPLFMLHSGETWATCLTGTSWAPVSKFKPSCHVVYTISTQEQISLKPQGIWVTWAQNEKQTWLQVLSALLLCDSLKGVFDLNKKCGRELVHKAL